MSFFDELKRRNVFRIGIAYAISAWILLQVVDLVLENIDAPPLIMQVFMLAIAVGFPIALIFAWAFEITPEGVKLEKHVDRSKSIVQQTGQKMNRHIIIALSIAVVFLLVDRFIPDKDTDPQPTVEKQEITEAVAVDAQVLEKSIAVLPFVNMSSDPEQDYFADGISEEILNALAGVNELKVAGRTSSFAFKGKNEDLLAIGKVLRVNHILEGSVRKSGNRVRITAQLIKVDDGFHMWSETFDREINDIFVIQDEISAAILVQLKAQLLDDLPVSTPTDTKAYELYLLAKQRIYERNQASLEMAIKLVTEAIEIDGAYAPAYAQLGIATLLVSDRNYGTLPHEQAGEQAKQALDTALQLDPENAEALAGMGLYYRNWKRDHKRALDVLRKSVAINPSLVNANTWLASQLRLAGHLRESVSLREQIFERDPLHAATFSNLQQSYVVMGQSEKALDMLDGLQAYLPSNALLLNDYAQVYYLTGRLAEAQKLFRQSYERDPVNAVGRVWYGFELMDSRQYELAAEVAPDHVAVMALSRLGRTEEALILGRKITDAGQLPVFFFQALVENGRFAELIQVLESRWASLDDFSRSWPGRRGYGYGVMASIAEAYRVVGNEAKFNDAMKRLKASLDAQQAEGADNWVLSYSLARYAMLTNDHEAAISYLEKAFQQGAYLDTENETAFPMFKPLDGDPRYEAVKAKMNARLENELEKMEIAQTATGK
jgi:TolB-like protein/cytochrome c-type biogenesis protein CcmH/NrfG